MRPPQPWKISSVAASMRPNTSWVLVSWRASRAELRPTIESSNRRWLYRGEPHAFQLALLAMVLSLSAADPGATARTHTDASDSASTAVNPTPPDEARSVPPPATPPTLPDAAHKSVPPGPLNPR